MARMHARRKGKSGSTHPIRKEHPGWSMLNPRETETKIVEFSKEGKNSSQIGIILRDQYAVPDVKIATGKKISQILDENSMKKEIPEDLMSLITGAVKLRKHLEEHKKDIKNKRNLQLIESKIRRLAKYYTHEKRLPEKWRYNIEQAKLMVE